MGYIRIFRRVHIAPGLTVNLSKSGPSLSLGVRGAHVTVGRRGLTRTVGLPGSGVFYTSRSGGHTGAHTAAHFAPAATAEARSHAGGMGALGCLLWVIGGLVVLGAIGLLLGPRS